METQWAGVEDLVAVIDTTMGTLSAVLGKQEFRTVSESFNFSTQALEEQSFMKIQWHTEKHHSCLVTTCAQARRMPARRTCVASECAASLRHAYHFGKTLASLFASLGAFPFHAHLLFGWRSLSFLPLQPDHIIARVSAAEEAQSKVIMLEGLLSSERAARTSLIETMTVWSWTCGQQCCGPGHLPVQ
eukprot:scaffold250590_cov18-Tisochrysis_lutea.AAC.1